MTPSFVTFLKKYVLFFFAVLIVLLGVFIYLYKATHDELRLTQEEFFNTRTRLEGEIAHLTQELAEERGEKETIQNELTTEKNKNEEFAEQIQEIAGTVGVLEKLSKTDEELLQKYSKVYFLNEHYIPSQLSDIEPHDLYYEDQTQQIHSRVLPYLERMIDDAKDDDVTLYIRSAYRSFGTQTTLKERYTVTYGSGANTFSADQGFSEHQLGTTVDFTTVGINGGLAGFGETEAFRWLTNNAHRYGFTLSYPKDNSYYVYEPWHWRFVGVELATRLYEEEKHFYDLDQRTIDEYLVNIFD